MGHLALLLLAACAAHGGESGDGGSGSACPFDGGSTWSSVEELECGLGPDGVVLCHWSLSFDEDGSWTWHYSDVGASGTWSCADTPSATASSGEAIDLSYDPGSVELSWEGVVYTPSAN